MTAAAMVSAPDIVALGEPLIEFNHIDRASSSYVQGFGGDVSNAAIAAARQGARVGLVSRVGMDRFGELLFELWNRENVDTSVVARDTQASTGLYFITHTPQGHVFNYLRAGSAASRLCPENLPLDYIAGARWLHVSGISQAISTSACDAVFAAIAAAQAAGVKVSYDSNLRLKLWPLDRALITVRATAAMADVFLPSFEDIAVLGGVTDAEQAMQWCLDAGARTVVLKLGRDGVMVHADGERYSVPPYRVEAIDSTGAGDCFAGALLAELCEGATLRDAVGYANAAAALTTTGFGAVAPIPTRQRVEKFLASEAKEKRYAG